MTRPTPHLLDLKRESKLWCLLPGCGKESRLEASGVLAYDGRFHVIFDNDTTIASLDISLEKRPTNRIVRAVGAHFDEEYGFEDITFSDRLQRFYTLVETRWHPGKGFRPQIVEYTAAFDYLETCWVNVAFKKENKGLEGIVCLKRGNDDYDYVLGLCEDDFRSGGDNDGKKCGLIYVLCKRDGAWDSIAQIKLPESLRFEDYSSVAMRGDRLAVLSQESAQLWIGILKPDRWELVDEWAVYHFPNGKKDYCNLEGVSWLDDMTVVVVSDRRKKDDQSECCAERDQSIHIFKLP